MTTSPTWRTYSLLCQLRDMPSHFSGVVMSRSADWMAAASGAVSPVSSTTRFPSTPRRLPCLVQSSILSLASAFSGAMYTAFMPGWDDHSRSMASSAVTVYAQENAQCRGTVRLCDQRMKCGSGKQCDGAKPTLCVTV